MSGATDTSLASRQTTFIGIPLMGVSAPAGGSDAAGIPRTSVKVCAGAGCPASATCLRQGPAATPEQLSLPMHSSDSGPLFPEGDVAGRPNAG